METYYDENGNLRHPKEIELMNIFRSMEEKGMFDGDLPGQISDLERIGFQIEEDVDDIARRLGLNVTGPKHYEAREWSRPGDGYVFLRSEQGTVEIVKPGKRILQDLQPSYTHHFTESNIVVDANRIMVRSEEPMIKYELN